MLRDRESVFYAVCSGCCACAASLFGKLAGKEDLDSMVSVVTATVFMVLMIVTNAAVWTFFVKALRSSDTSLFPTVASSATNYICSAMAGFWFFGEITSLMWWTGTFLVLVGLLLICQYESNEKLQSKLK
ncbi:transmembrane protein 42 [Schistocerca gregaria]|uniref:transmembrane protein 42 n=1 Tax=Schistocerca gregaria TaxID=7010 RepID=UPI00211DC4B9|nr:transmembrane protein 42 [Schistocerca gregaria]